MAISDTQPDNPNFLPPSRYRFVMKKIPHVTYYAQSVQIPGMTLGEYNRETPFVKIPVPGEKITFAPYTITFKVDEDLKNYMEIYNWINGLGFPDNYEQFSNELSRPNEQVNHLPNFKNAYSDGTLLILTSHHNPNIRVNFEDMFPTDLGEMRFDTTDEGVEHISCDCTFTYTKFTLETVNN